MRNTQQKNSSFYYYYAREILRKNMITDGMNLWKKVKISMLAYLFIKSIGIKS